MKNTREIVKELIGGAEKLPEGGWLIPYSHMSGPAKECFEKMIDVIKRGGQVDVVARCDGKDYRWECDGLKYAKKVTKG